MTMPLEQRQSLLLELLLRSEPANGHMMTALDPEDWDHLMAMVREHRLGPLLHWRLDRSPDGLDVPAGVRAQLRRLFRAATLRALNLQRELVQLHRVLHRAGIPDIALKGAYLAAYAYPHPALRPMRDLDILVPASQVLTAFAVLLEAGYRRMAEGPGDPEATLEVSKHLPPLLAPSGKVKVELHHLLCGPYHSAGQAGALGTDPGLWDRRIRGETAGESLTFLSETDLLLHLIVHAVYDHRFSNGPLALSDLGFLLADAKIDWPLFWELAERGGWTRGCLLALSMAAYYRPDLPIAWPEAGPPRPCRELVRQANGLTLRDFARRSDTQLHSELGRGDLVSRVGVLWRRGFPSPRVMASRYPAAADSFRIYGCYPWHWGRLLFQRGPTYMRSRWRQRTHQEAAAITRLERWLEEG